MDTALINLAYSFLSLVIPVIAVMVVELIRRYLGLQKMAQVNEAITNKKALALIAGPFCRTRLTRICMEKKSLIKRRHGWPNK